MSTRGPHITAVKTKTRIVRANLQKIHIHFDDKFCKFRGNYDRVLGAIQAVEKEAGTWSYIESRCPMCGGVMFVRGRYYPEREGLMLAYCADGCFRAWE